MTLPSDSSYRVSKKRNKSRIEVVPPLDSSIRYIPLTKGQIAIVDAILYVWLIQWNWSAKWCRTSKQFYVSAWDVVSGKPRIIRMHRLILGLQVGDERVCDHINGNTLDNRIDNLRVATRGQNPMNHKTYSNNNSGCPGVYWHKHNGNWVAYIYIKHTRIHLGCFPADQKAQAIATRKAAEDKHFGEFARNTHPSG